MNNNRQQHHQPTGDESREELIEGIKGGIPQRYAEFLSMSADDQREYLEGARKLVAGFKGEAAREFCTNILNAMEAAQVSEMATEDNKILDLSQMPPAHLKTDDSAD
jgi:phytoene/squalene synthetase